MPSDRAFRSLLIGGFTASLVAASFAGCSSSSKKRLLVPDAAAGEGGASDQAGEAGISGAGDAFGTSAGAAGNGAEAGEPAESLGGDSMGGNDSAGDTSGGETPGGGTSGGGTSGGGTSGGGEGGTLGTRAGAGGAVAIAGAGAAGSPDPCATTGSHVIVAFDATDPERVTNLQWIENASLTTANLVAQGGPLSCGDPIEYFGQAYGAEAQLPAPIVAGHVATLVGCGFDATITAAATDCSAAAQFPVTTKYHLYTGAQADQLRVTRSFANLNAGPPNYGQGILRAYVPRLPVGQFPSVIYPNQSNTAITTISIAGCGTDCLVAVGPNWSGRWFADVDPASGRAMVVLRDPAMTLPARLAGNNDGFSGSNLTSFLLSAIDGWPQPLTEIEYLCFEDLTTWPQADRDIAKLPTGCGP